MREAVRRLPCQLRQGTVFKEEAALCGAPREQCTQQMGGWRSRAHWWMHTAAVGGLGRVPGVADTHLEQVDMRVELEEQIAQVAAKGGAGQLAAPRSQASMQAVPRAREGMRALQEEAARAGPARRQALASREQ